MPGTRVCCANAVQGGRTLNVLLLSIEMFHAPELDAQHSCLLVEHAVLPAHHVYPAVAVWELLPGTLP